MAEEKRSQSWWQTVPGILTATGGVITAVATLIGVLNQSGVFDDEGKSQPPVTRPIKSATLPPVSIPPKEITPNHTSEQPTDGWMIIGKSKHGKFFDLKLMIHEDSPAIGKRYDAVEDFRLVHKRPEKGVDQGQVITLGMVRRGDSVEILDLYIETPSTKTVPVWAKLRAVLHKR